MGPQILWLKFSHYASKNIKPKELIFPKVTLKREARQTKIQILSFPTHWFSLTWPLTQPLTSLSDPSLTLTLLGPFNLIISLVFNSESSSLGETFQPGAGSFITCSHISLIHIPCRECIPACNCIFKNETISWRSSFLTKLSESRNIYMLLSFTSILPVQEASLNWLFVEWIHYFKTLQK